MSCFSFFSCVPSTSGFILKSLPLSSLHCIPQSNLRKIKQWNISEGLFWCLWQTELPQRSLWKLRLHTHTHTLFLISGNTNNSVIEFPKHNSTELRVQVFVYGIQLKLCLKHFFNKNHFHLSVTFTDYSGLFFKAIGLCIELRIEYQNCSHHYSE